MPFKEICALGAPRFLDVLAERRALTARYRGPVADRLQRLYEAGDPAQDRDRFIVVSICGRALGDVQCRVHDRETTMLCEAESGVSLDTPGTPRTTHLAQDAIAALGRLGVSTDESAGTFVLDTEVAAPPDARDIADLILRAPRTTANRAGRHAARVRRPLRARQG